MNKMFSSATEPRLTMDNFQPTLDSILSCDHKAEAYDMFGRVLRVCLHMGLRGELSCASSPIKTNAITTIISIMQKYRSVVEKSKKDSDLHVHDYVCNIRVLYKFSQLRELLKNDYTSKNSNHSRMHDHHLLRLQEQEIVAINLLRNLLDDSARPRDRDTCLHRQTRTHKQEKELTQAVDKTMTELLFEDPQPKLYTILGSVLYFATKLNSMFELFSDRKEIAVTLAEYMEIWHWMVREDDCAELSFAEIQDHLEMLYKLRNICRMSLKFQKEIYYESTVAYDSALFNIRLQELSTMHLFRSKLSAAALPLVCLHEQEEAAAVDSIAAYKMRAALRDMRESPQYDDRYDLLGTDEIKKVNYERFAVKKKRHFSPQQTETSKQDRILDNAESYKVKDTQETSNAIEKKSLHHLEIALEDTEVKRIEDCGVKHIENPSKNTLEDNIIFNSSDIVHETIIDKSLSTETNVKQTSEGNKENVEQTEESNKKNVKQTAEGNKENSLLVAVNITAELIEKRVVDELSTFLEIIYAFDELVDNFGKSPMLLVYRQTLLLMEKQISLLNNYNGPAKNLHDRFNRQLLSLLGVLGRCCLNRANTTIADLVECYRMLATIRRVFESIEFVYGIPQSGVWPTRIREQFIYLSRSLEVALQSDTQFNRLIQRRYELSEQEVMLMLHLSAVSSKSSPPDPSSPATTSVFSTSNDSALGDSTLEALSSDPTCPESSNPDPTYLKSSTPDSTSSESSTTDPTCRQSLPKHRESSPTDLPCPQAVCTHSADMPKDNADPESLLTLPEDSQIDGIITEPSQTDLTYTVISADRHMAVARLLSVVTSLHHLRDVHPTKTHIDLLQDIFIFTKEALFFAVECAHELEPHERSSVISAIEECLAIHVIRDSKRKYRFIDYDCASDRSTALQTFVDVSDMLLKLKFRLNFPPTDQTVMFIAQLEVEPSISDFKCSEILRIARKSETYFSGAPPDPELTLRNVDPCLSDWRRPLQFAPTVKLPSKQNKCVKPGLKQLSTFKKYFHMHLGSTSNIAELLSRQLPSRICYSCKKRPINQYDEFLILHPCVHVLCIDCLDQWVYAEHMIQDGRMMSCPECDHKVYTWTTRTSFVNHKLNKGIEMDKLISKWNED